MTPARRQRYARPAPSRSTDRLRETVGAQVVGLGHTLGDLRAELARLRAQNLALLERERAQLRDELTRVEVAHLRQARTLEQTREELARQRNREDEVRSLEARHRQLTDRCKDLELGMARETQTVRALREEMDRLLDEVERLCAVVGAALGEEDAGGEEGAG